MKKDTETTTKEVHQETGHHLRPYFRSMTKANYNWLRKAVRDPSWLPYRTPTWDSYCEYWKAKGKDTPADRETYEREQNNDRQLLNSFGDRTLVVCDQLGQVYPYCNPWEQWSETSLRHETYEDGTEEYAECVEREKQHFRELFEQLLRANDVYNNPEEVLTAVKSALEGLNDNKENWRTHFFNPGCVGFSTFFPMHLDFKPNREPLLVGRFFGSLSEVRVPLLEMMQAYDCKMGDDWHAKSGTEAYERSLELLKEHFQDYQNNQRPTSSPYPEENEDFQVNLFFTGGKKTYLVGAKDKEEAVSKAEQVFQDPLARVPDVELYEEKLFLGDEVENYEVERM